MLSELVVFFSILISPWFQFQYVGAIHHFVNLTVSLEATLFIGLKIISLVYV